MIELLREFSSWYWTCDFAGPELRDAYEATGTATTPEELERAFLVLLRSDDTVARGTALDFFDRAEALTRFGRPTRSAVTRPRCSRSRVSCCASHPGPPTRAPTAPDPQLFESLTGLATDTSLPIDERQHALVALRELPGPAATAILVAAIEGSEWQTKHEAAWDCSPTAGSTPTAPC